MKKRKLTRRILIAIPLILVAFVAVCAILLNTNAFRSFLISTIRSQALERTGARIEIGSVETHWIKFGLDLNDIVVHGNETPALSASPLLQAKRLEVSIHFWPLLHGKVHFRDLILDEPTLHIRIDALGDSNLPVPPKPTSHDTTGEIFDLEVGNCAIRSGEIYYNDVQTPLNAELHDLKFQAGYSHLTAKYTGSLAYDKGSISAPQIEPVAHSVELRFAADRSGISLTPLVLTSGESHLTLNARLNDYAQPLIEGSYAADIFTPDVTNLLSLASLPVGQVSLDGSFGYRSSEQASTIDALELQGRLRSARLALRTGERPVEFAAVSASYELRNGDLKVNDVSAGVLGGAVRANYEMQRLDSPHAISRLEASLRGASLKRASDTFAPRDVQRIPVVGTANLDVRASWAGTLDNAIAHVRLAVSNNQTKAASDIPLSGLIQADYDGPRNTISFGQSELQTSNTKLDIAGMLSSRRSGNSNISVQVSTADLREVRSMAGVLQGALSNSPPLAIPELGGSASLHATITGAVKNPQIAGRLTASNLTVDDSHWNSLALNLAAQPSKVAIQDVVLVGNAREQIDFSGTAALHDWSLTPTSPISAQAKATALSLADAAKIAGLHYPVCGIASANVSLSGTRQNLEANGTVTITHASAWNEPIDNLFLNASSANGAIHSTMNLQAPAGKISAEATYKPATQQYDVSLHGGKIDLAKISTLQRSVPLQGAIDISATGAGTIQNPQLQANVASPKLQIHDQMISGIAAQIGLADHHANLTLHSTVYQGAVDAKADIDLNGGRYATASLDVRSLPIAPVLAQFVSTDTAKISGQTEIHLALKGPLAAPAQIEAHLEIPWLNVAYEKVQIALAQPLHADFQNGAITIAPTRIQGTGTNLTFGGTIPIRSTAAPSLSADGSIDLGVFQQFAPDVHSSGQVLVHVRSEGTSASGMRGQLQLKNAIFSTDSIPVGIEGLNAQINFSGTRADIENFSGSAGGGTVAATGSVSYDHGASFSLAVNAKSVRIRYPEGLRSVLSGQINLQGNPDSSTLTGRVFVDRLSFTQAFDLANFAGYFSEDSTGAPPSAFERHMRLNVAVQSAQDLSLASSKLSVGGSANINVVGTLADPVVLGRVALTSGEVFFLSKRFEVQSGTIEFANPVRTEPVLNLHVTTTVEQYNVTLTLSGAVDRLKTTYTSEPALPPADIIHLLAFGNTQEEAASAPSSTVADSAESVLAQGVSSQVAGKLENLTGISQVTIDPLATSSQGNPGSQVAIQERVTGSLLLTFSTDVTSTQSQTVELQYQLNKRVSVTVLRDQNGGYGIDLRVHKEF
jgi:translocation and assembly module TamB